MSFRVVFGKRKFQQGIPRHGSTSKEDLEKLWYLLKENVSPPDDGTQRINYD